MKKLKKYIIKKIVPNSFIVEISHRLAERFVKKYQKVDRWSTQNINQYKYCIARVLGREDIINELCLNSRELIVSNYEDLPILLKKVKDICDQFALGGLHYLRKEYENDSSLFDDAFALSNIYESSIKTP